MRLVDFVPAANWAAHRGDPLLQTFEALSTLLDRVGLRRAHVEVTFPKASGRPIGEVRTPSGVLSKLVPPQLNRALRRKSIRKYPDRIGHDLSYRLEWR